MTGEYKLEKTYQMKTFDVEFVWECLTDEDILSLWQGQECQFGSEEGSSISLFGGSVTGTVLKYQKERMVRFTWRGGDWNPDWEASVVTLEIVSRHPVVVRVIHENFPNQKELDGWLGSVLFRAAY